MACQNNWPTDLQDVPVIPLDQGDGPGGFHAKAGSSACPEPLTRMITRFKTKKLRHWNREDVVDWVFHACQERQIEFKLMNVAGFAELGGAQLADLTEDQFLNIEPIYGQELFLELAPYKRHKMSGGRLISESKDTDFRAESPLFFYDQYSNDTSQLGSSLGPTERLTVDVNYSHSNHSTHNYLSSPCHLMNNLSLDSTPSLSPGNTLSPYTNYQVDNTHYYNSSGSNFSPPMYQHSVSSDSRHVLSPSGSGISPDDTDSLFGDDHLGYSPPLTELTHNDLLLLDTPNSDTLQRQSPYWDLVGTDMSCQESADSSSTANKTTKFAAAATSTTRYPTGTLLSPTPQLMDTYRVAIAGRRRRTSSGGLASTSSSSGNSRTPSPRKERSISKTSASSSSSGGTVRPKPARKERGKKVWEFLLDLLKDPNSNPSMIRWENEDEGVFRLVEHDLIAQKWGQRRDRGDLSYDYFARTMRYQYTTHKLESVPERKLVYKFGPEVNDMIRQEKSASR